MSASPVLVTNNPLLLTARTLTYTAKDFRKVAGDSQGPGVLDQDSFRIRQRAAGANMSVDCMTTGVLNRAFLRGSVAADQGLYRIDFTGTPLNVDISTADPTNPRIDQIYLCIEDSEALGSGNNQATVRLVTGTPTGGATLDNRTGAGAAPASMSSILLADILVGAAAASIANAVIRDRRPYGDYGSGPSPFTALDAVTFMPPPGVVALASGQMQNTASFDSQQAAALMFLPRPIKQATRIRMRYVQGATANANQFIISICDASGRPKITGPATNYTGALNTLQMAVMTIAATDFEEGYYWIFLGNAAGTASATVLAAAGIGAPSTTSPGAFLPNQYVYATSGGITVPATILAMVDHSTITGAGTARPTVPIVTLSVG